MRNSSLTPTQSYIYLFSSLLLYCNLVYQNNGKKSGLFTFSQAMHRNRKKKHEKKSRWIVNVCIRNFRIFCKQSLSLLVPCVFPLPFFNKGLHYNQLTASSTLLVVDNSSLYTTHPSLSRLLL